ncbi:hypothetical protein PINS_up008348 [Pythium insidiosum]|nr:hypothetical protein PINS_up008348 [Pythium insidiosum]
MGLKSSRPLPQANDVLDMAPFFQRRFRSWHVDHVSLVMERYRALTKRHCVDAVGVAAILGIRDEAFIHDLVRLFMPRTPTRVHHMVDAMEIVIAIILVCQAPSMLRRFEAIFDVIDLNGNGSITSADVVTVFGAAARAVMKIFRYAVQPQQQDAMFYVRQILQAVAVQESTVDKQALCKFLLTDPFAVHYTKLCTGEDKPKLYILLEKDNEFLGTVEFHTEADMKNISSSCAKGTK